MSQEVHGTHERTHYVLMPEFRGWKLFTPAVTVLVALHIIAYLLLALPPPDFTLKIKTVLGLAPDKVFARLHLWQLLTHSFLSGAWSMVWMCVLLIFCGSGLERTWGWLRFVIFYALTSAAAGLVRMLPEIGGPMIVVGNLGAFCAVLAAFGTVFRHERVWLLFVNPRVPYVVIGMLVILLLLNIQPPENILWLSGAAFGVLYPRIPTAFQGKRAAPAPPESNRFSQIDLD